MATYTYSDPVAGVFPTQKDEVRFLLGDTTPAAPFSLSDEEIAYLIAQVGSSTERAVYLAASRAARRMSVAYAKQSASSKSVGDLSISYEYANVATAYMALANDLLTGSDTLGSDFLGGWGNLYESGPSVFGQGDFDNGEQIAPDPRWAAPVGD